ncbi:chemotaxis protein CheR [Meridianimarinicoccus roseus]|jgi:chemotaxis protein methyltransferase CheR|uniref:protein-glutamate O-methyltransferase n=1 Tax=Meridianimarinicoccus roseus TaxID=2072018 RepID=A0A2V2LGG3_9RHOB|nr:protein-glutamate O-methyltransferase CheR [Meridianimarinicoccus roseus]PWR02594.1 chemotaxis protein CheR [Meridianimarinicoccus roseus]
MIASDHVGFEEIRNWLSTRCGIVYAESKGELLRQRLSRVLRSFNLVDLDQLAAGLIRDENQAVQLAVMHAASTNHTFFFREPEVLNKFATQILPGLADRSQVRIWSAAASTGDEAYSVAMLAAETLGPAFLKRMAILGTDISAPVVERAELGVYARRQLAQTPPDMLRKHFKPTGIDQFRVNDDIRACCTFRRMNLKARPYPFSKPFQVVFCRNILYYFDKSDQINTLKAIHAVTEPGGWLVTSVTEPIRDLGTAWRPVSTGIYRRGE